MTIFLHRFCFGYLGFCSWWLGVFWLDDLWQHWTLGFLALDLRRYLFVSVKDEVYHSACFFFFFFAVANEQLQTEGAS